MYVPQKLGGDGSVVQYDEMYPKRKDKKSVKKAMQESEDADTTSIHVGVNNLLKDKSNFKLYYPKKAEWIIICVGYNSIEGRYNHRF